ncbi:MAG: hypothetical protein K5896_07710 [Prevotella sp.]|nr:hypothetical protein [Prevotella sp.]
MKKTYIQPDIKVVRIKVDRLLGGGSPITPAKTSTNIEGLEGYDSNGGDASCAW